MGSFKKRHEAQRIFNVTLIHDNQEKQVTLKNYPNRFQKRLLAATVSEDPQLMYKEIINVLNESIIEPENFDLNSVPYFEIHKLFLALVSNSYQNNLAIEVNCDNHIKKTSEDGEETETLCQGKVKTVIDLDKVEVAHVKELDYDCSSFKIKFKYPSFVEYITFMEKLLIEDPTAKFIAISELITDCIDEVYDDNQRDKFNELDKEDQEFIIDSIRPELFHQVLRDIIKPYVYVAIPFVCPECNHKKKVELKGLENFFR